MAASRKPRLFEYRGQWIGEEPGRVGFYRYWYDQRTRKVKRRALEAQNIEEAKEELIDILGSAGASRGAPEAVSLADVMAHYLEHKAEPKGPRAASAARRAAELALEAAETFSSHPTVAHLTRLNQQRMWAYMSSEHGLSPKSITTYMISVRAAVNFAAIPQIVAVGDEKQEVQLLTSATPVFCNQSEIADHVGGEMSRPRDYIPTFEDLGRWIDRIQHEDDFRYVIIALNTAARNEAIFDLRVDGQVDFNSGTIDLNPPGRRQTKKRRPVIRLTTGLAAWLDHWGDDRPIRQYQDTVEKRLNAMGKDLQPRDQDGRLLAPLSMPDMTCYTLRHFIATNMRRAGIEVSREQRSKWLGHVVAEGSRTTDWYEKFDPDYLEDPMRATEMIIQKLQNHTHKSLLAPTMHSQGTLRVVSGHEK